ncbi:hypothetical protein CGGC5_v016008 [Colletotrichum fructicola Nara gc5]|uniref:Uncharacterized protein n=1 Tax=Colletotrichum fructicola (strain Nara gc5) TaxID=1213859 RepID=A0A7J6IHM1_COLFN|nr:hypothetical protein CGGC5_v016008 [Colletotrichum fructicola Nara gc5]
MGYAKEQLIQAMEEEREDLTQTLDDIEAVGENYACPNNDCKSKSDTLQRMLLGTLYLGQKPKTDEFVGIKLRENILAIAIS